MHRYTSSSSQRTSASGQQLDRVEAHEPDEAATRLRNASIRSGNVSPVLRSSLDPVSALTQSPDSDAALKMSKDPASSDQTGNSTDHPPVSSLGKRPRWKQTWITPVTILGFYFISSHYCFFAYLDGRIIFPGSIPSTNTTTVPQAYATTVSLVLVTAFRAAIVASIGACYTQCLWATFRKRALKISLIEDLFQVQANPLRLFNYHLYSKTPMLLAAATFCWLVPIATLYPPGTLVVELQSSSIDQSFNVSVFHHRTLQDISNNNVIAKIGCSYDCKEYPIGTSCSIGPPQFPEAAENASLLETCESSRLVNNIAHESSSMTTHMQYLTRSNLIVGEISRLSQASQENTSYELEFLGTTLDCETTNRTMESTISHLKFWGPSTSHPEMMVWQIQHPEHPCELSPYFSSNVSGNTSITYRVASYQDMPRYWPCLDKNTWVPTLDEPLAQHTQDVEFPGSGMHIIVPITETVCHPKMVKYHVTIAHPGGGQHVSYSVEDQQFMPAHTSKFKDFNGSFELWAQLSDGVQIYEDFAQIFHQFSTDFRAIEFEFPSMSNETKPYTTENGTVVETCILESKPVSISPVGGERSPSYELWAVGVFEQRIQETPLYGTCPAFDPDMANELLINTTISALALNQRFDTVNGTETRTFNVYRFENKLAFFLPYGLSLALAIPILVLGLLALYVQNHGVSAISGGFMQLLMTTTGRTSLEAVVMRGSGTLGGYENVSEELRGMEVRFGELVEVSGDEIKETDTLLSGHDERVDVQNDDSSQSGVQTASGLERFEDSVSMVRKAGFGTVDEVMPFRKEEAEQ